MPTVVESPLRKLRVAVLLGLTALMLGFMWFNSPAKEGGRPDLSTIKLPSGFQIEIYQDGVKGARSLALSPSGTLFVSTIQEGVVYAIPNKDRDTKGDKVIVVASGLNWPNGIALKDGSLYVAEVSRVLKYEDIEARLSDPPAPLVVNDSFPHDRHHGWKYIRFGPDGWLYIPVGAPCNVCEREDQRYASLMRMKSDGSNLEVFARGIRNTVGFDWHPLTKEAWFTDNGRDWLGDDLPPDELNHAPKTGLHFGFPYRYGNNVADPQYGSRGRGIDFVPPALPLAPHVAALGMRFYTGSMFPAQYHHQVFIAEHGSWNRSKPIGYRVTLVRFHNGQPAKYEVFADGWLKTNGDAWGRPVDLAVAGDGALLVSDDRAGLIYRISYGNK